MLIAFELGAVALTIAVPPSLPGPQTGQLSSGCSRTECVLSIQFSSDIICSVANNLQKEAIVRDMCMKVCDLLISEIKIIRKKIYLCKFLFD